MKTECSYCGKELERQPCRAKGNNFCNPTCQNKFMYKDKKKRKEITKKANKARREQGLKKFRENPTTKIGKRGYKLIYIPSLISEKEGGHWKKYHHYIWEKHHNKKIPEGYCVHHKDGNPLNNEIENLELMTIKKHNKIDRNLPTGKDHPNWKEDVKSVGTEFNCEFCGKKGKRTRINQKYCSPSCASKSRWAKPDAKKEASKRLKKMKRNSKGQFIKRQ